MSILPEWTGRAAFIVAGGPSVLSQDLELLRGRCVIAINDSHERIPWADILFFADARWWVKHRESALRFAGRIVTTSDVALPDGDPAIDRVRRCRRVTAGNGEPLRLCREPDGLAVRRTSVTAAMNLAFHLGAMVLVLLGVDGCRASDGRCHHYNKPRPIDADRMDKQFELQAADLRSVADDLRGAGVTVLNASPGSVFDFWPVVSLSDAVSRTN